MRLSAMHRFLEAPPAGLERARCRTDALPHLRIADGAFDLTLCSHLLFLHSDALSLVFHLAAVEEMSRVAGEVRVFPLLGAFGAPLPPHPRPLVCALGDRGGGYAGGTPSRAGACPTSSCGAPTRLSPSRAVDYAERESEAGVRAPPSAEPEGVRDDLNSVISASIHMAP